MVGNTFYQCFNLQLCPVTAVQSVSQLLLGVFQTPAGTWILYYWGRIAPFGEVDLFHAVVKEHRNTVSSPVLSKHHNNVGCLSTISL